MGLLIYLTTILSLLSTLPSASALQEKDRIKEYETRGHQWPPLDDEFQPNIPAYRKIFDRRFSQLRNMEDSNQRYNGYMTTIHAALTCKNFTEHGWGLTRAPQVGLMLNVWTCGIGFLLSARRGSLWVTRKEELK